MVNGHGGYRPGAGRRPRDLNEVIDYRQVRLADGTVEQVPVTIMDRLEEALRTGGFLHDAAARIGVTVETVRDWRKQGNKALADVLAGTKRRSQLSKRQRQYAELAYRLERAEADGRLNLLALGQKVAAGGWERTETSVRTVAAQGGVPTVVETTQKTIVAAPDSHMITWLLAHRWPNDFAGRVELTGPDGGPIQHDATSALDKLRAAVDQTNANMHPNGHQPTPPTPQTPVT